MQSVKKYIKVESFRQNTNWNQLAKKVCSWVNTNINVLRITAISAVHCYYSPYHKVDIFYNDGQISQDILMQAGNYVLTYEHLNSEKSWVSINKELANKTAQITERGEVVAITMVQAKEKSIADCIIWYKRMK